MGRSKVDDDELSQPLLDWLQPSLAPLLPHSGRTLGRLLSSRLHQNVLVDNITQYNAESRTYSPHAFHADVLSDPMEMSSRLSVAAVTPSL